MTLNPPNKSTSGKTIAGAVTGACMLIALPFTAQHEGLRTKAYLDPVGIPTICFGETQGVQIGQVKTAQECDNMLMVRLGYFSWQVDQLVQPELNPCQMASLSSLSYNIGLANFKNSTILKKINSGDLVGASNQFGRWVYAKGKLLPGLVKRREAERRLFLNDCSDMPELQTKI